MNRTSLRTPLRTLAAVTSAAVLALGAAGCGSSGDTKADEKTLSADEFRTQANALCKSANTEVADIEADADISTPAGAEEAVTAFTDRIAALVSDLEKLAPPADLADDVEKMLAEVSDVVDSAKEQGADFLGTSTDPFADADKQAMALGLEECAGNTNSAAPLSAGEFTVKADGVCKAANDKLNTITEGIADVNKPTEADLATISGRLVDYVTTEIADLKALVPPTEIAEAVDTWLTDFDGVLTVAKDEGGKFFDRTANPFGDTNAQAKALGLEACATTAE